MNCEQFCAGLTDCMGDCMDSCDNFAGASGTPCDAELRAAYDCARQAQTYCDADGNFAVDGCDTEGNALVACIQANLGQN